MGGGGTTISVVDKILKFQKLNQQVKHNSTFENRLDLPANFHRYWVNLLFLGIQPLEAEIKEETILSVKYANLKITLQSTVLYAINPETS